MGLTTDPNDPGLQAVHSDGQQQVYLVLSEEERAKGFVRPVRHKYQHVGLPAPANPLRDLTPEEHARYDQFGYAQFEEYPEPRGSVTGRFWTQQEIDSIGKGCQAVTRMGQALAETYARDPRFYSGTFCSNCGRHFPVGPQGEFVWDGTDERVGT